MTYSLCCCASTPWHIHSGTLGHVLTRRTLSGARIVTDARVHLGTYYYLHVLTLSGAVIVGSLLCVMGFAAAGAALWRWKGRPDCEQVTQAK